MTWQQNIISSPLSSLKPLAQLFARKLMLCYQASKSITVIQSISKFGGAVYFSQHVWQSESCQVRSFLSCPLVGWFVSRISHRLLKTTGVDLDKGTDAGFFYVAFLGIFIHFYGSNAWILMKNIRCFYLKTGFPHNSLCIFRVPHRLLTPTPFPFNTTNSDKKNILTIISVFTFSVYNKYTCGGIFNSAMICSGFEMIHVAPLHRAEFASLNPADTLSQCKYVQS